MEINSKVSIKQLLSLTIHNKYIKIKELLESSSPELKGNLFEEYLAVLYKGNGWLAQVTGERGDAGADILLRHPETPNKVSIIIQAKNHKSPITVDNTTVELIKFENQASKKYNCDSYSIVSINGYVKEALKLSQFNMSLLDWTYVTDLIKNFDANNTSKPRLELVAHNLSTYNTTKELFKTQQRVSTIQATGTGKSYLIGQHLLDNVDKQCLVLAPSTFILEQQERLLPWLNNVMYMTYSKASYCTNVDWKTLLPEFIVLDEFHRGGADTWGKGLERLFKAAPDAKVFGTTATHIRYLDNARNMADELFDGTIANEITLQEAIAKKILPAPYYVSALYSFKEEAKQMLKDIGNCKATPDDKESATNEIKRLAVDWESSLGVPDILDKHLKEVSGKFIVFCEDIEAMDVMKDEVPIWFRKAAKKRNQTVKRKSYIIHSRQTDSDNKTIIKEFTAAKTDNSVHILLAVNILNEGLHIKGVSGVILLRKTTSPIIYFQQIGRCLLVNGGLQPVIFDLVNNMANVQSQQLQFSIDKAIDIEQSKRSEFGLPALNYDLHIVDETYNLRQKLDEVEKRLGMDLSTFDRGYAALVDYREEHGNCNVPRGFKTSSGLTLEGWIHYIRSNYKANKLSPERVQRLEEIGFDWVPIETAFQIRFKALLDYKEAHGDCNVQMEFKTTSGLALGKWIHYMRTYYNANKLSPERVQRLEEIGFKWDAREAEYEASFNALLNYRKAHGDCNVPKGFKTSSGLALGVWISNRRSDYKVNKLSPERVQRLEEIGFDLDPIETEYKVGFKALHDYKEEYGDCNVPSGFKTSSGFSLGGWVRNRRKEYKANKLSPERVQRLEEIDFDWDPMEAEYKAGFKALQDYKEVHGDCNVARAFKTSSGFALGGWVSNRRSNYKANKLTPERIQKLEEIDFDWDPIETEYKAGFKALQDYKEEYGDCNVPMAFKTSSGFALGGWISNRRTDYNANKLSPERVQRLEEICFYWDPREAEYKVGFKALQDYKEAHGDCNVTSRYKTSSGLALGSWVRSRRTEYNANKLSPERVQRLEELGLQWKVK
jgi:superfamily II DNA or RNA helicase